MGLRKDHGMKIRRQIVVFDAADLAAESGFWAGLLGGTVEADDDWHSVVVDGEWRLGVQLAPNHVPPDWPDGTPQQQPHRIPSEGLPDSSGRGIGCGGECG